MQYKVQGKVIQSLPEKYINVLFPDSKISGVMEVHVINVTTDRTFFFVYNFFRKFFKTELKLNII
jgi:hypothetical protein